MSDLNRKSKYENDYERTQVKFNPLINECWIWKHKTQPKKIICFESFQNSQKIIEEQIQSVKRKKLLQNQYFINLLDYSTEVIKDWCATNYKLREFYEFPGENLLAATARPEARTKKELTMLMYHQVSANCTLQEMELVHGNICPESIYKLGPTYKISIRQVGKGGEWRARQRKKLKFGLPIYMSPEVYRASFSNSFSAPQFDAHKSDVFSLGLVLLQAGLGADVQVIYQNGEVNREMLDELVKEFELKFSDNPLLFSSVKKMLDLSEEDRPDFLALKHALPDYEEIVTYFEKLENGELESEEEMDYQEDSIINNYGFNNENQQFDLLQTQNNSQPPSPKQEFVPRESVNLYQSQQVPNPDPRQSGQIPVPISSGMHTANAIPKIEPLSDDFYNNSFDAPEQQFG